MNHVSSLMVWNTVTTCDMLNVNVHNTITCAHVHGNYKNNFEIFKECSGSFCIPNSNYSKNVLRVIYYVKRYFHIDLQSIQFWSTLISYI